MKKLVQIKSNRWETEEGDYIWKDDFGTYIIKVNGIMECADTFDKAVKILNSDRYNG